MLTLICLWETAPGPSLASLSEDPARFPGSITSQWYPVELRVPCSAHSCSDAVPGWCSLWESTDLCFNSELCLSYINTPSQLLGEFAAYVVFSSLFCVCCQGLCHFNGTFLSVLALQPKSSTSCPAGLSHATEPTSEGVVWAEHDLPCKNKPTRLVAGSPGLRDRKNIPCFSSRLCL